MDLQPAIAPNGGSERAWSAIIVGLFAVGGLLAIGDLASDFGHRPALGHVLVEGAIFAACGLGAALGLRRLAALRARERAARVEAAELGQRLAASRVEAERWRGEARDLLDGLGQAIDRQLDRWGLSPAEKEIAVLLLKGLGHKEVAAVRQVAEATVRQQARGVYKKAGLEGRHDLAAFFLEGLLAPVAERGEGTAP